MKIHSKENFKKAVNNIDNLTLNATKSGYKMTFERFMKDEGFTAVLSTNLINTNKDINPDWLDGYMDKL